MQAIDNSSIVAESSTALPASNLQLQATLTELSFDCFLQLSQFFGGKTLEKSGSLGMKKIFECKHTLRVCETSVKMAGHCAVILCEL